MDKKVFRSIDFENNAFKPPIECCEIGKKSRQKNQLYYFYLKLYRDLDIVAKRGKIPLPYEMLMFTVEGERITVINEMSYKFLILSFRNYLLSVIVLNPRGNEELTTLRIKPFNREKSKIPYYV